MRTNYSWKAVYADNTFLYQYDGSKENLFKDIDFSRLVSFVLFKDDREIRVSISVTIFLDNVPIIFFPSSRLIYFRRIRRNINNVETSNFNSVKHVFGLQTTIDNKNVKLMFYLDDVSGEIGYVNE